MLAKVDVEKTTLIKLLQGFYKPTSGSIKVGNTLLDNINPHSWRAATGSVMQDSFIFSDTIAGNIAVNKDKLDRNLMKIAAKFSMYRIIYRFFTIRIRNCYWNGRKRNKPRTTTTYTYC